MNLALMQQNRSIAWDFEHFCNSLWARCDGILFHGLAKSDPLRYGLGVLGVPDRALDRLQVQELGPAPIS